MGGRLDHIRGCLDHLGERLDHIGAGLDISGGEIDQGMRTRNAVGRRAAGECFHSFFAFPKTIY